VTHARSRSQEKEDSSLSILVGLLEAAVVSNGYLPFFAGFFAAGFFAAAFFAAGFFAAGFLVTAIFATSSSVTCYVRICLDAQKALYSPVWSCQ